VSAENSGKKVARSTTLYIRNVAGKEDYFFIFAQRHFLYTGRWAQLQTSPYENKESAYNNLHHCKLLQFIWTGDRSKPLSNKDLTGD
jgi:hypothetical protein